MYGADVWLKASSWSVAGRRPITPLFKALASWVHYEAGLSGSKGRTSGLTRRC
jgi:hypothetical protein